MAVDKDELSPTVLAIAITCFLALAISVGFFKLFLTKPKRKKSCYLNTESKPQYAFKRVLADNSYSQFKHLSLPTGDSQSGEKCSNVHPYGEEISMLIKNPNLEFVECLDGLEKGDLELGSSRIWVDTEDQLTELVEVLSNELVFAVDTEQHSSRSFLGFTALIQISTGNKDYLVDTIALHDMMGLLRPVFGDPGICKVFHGADNDVLWLQRDFHIYVVNLFDTAKSCDILSKPQRSLAYLLEAYCDVSSNKLLQREDWRQRPLPKEMIEYAQMDAHYLLYIASCLCMELKFQKSENSSPGDKFHFLLEASRRSNAICMQLFAKDIEAFSREVAASSLISRVLNDQGNISSSLHDNKFQELVGRLCLWRDIMARLHDESLRFVLSDNAIIALADRVPATETDICTTVSKADQYDSPLVCSHSEDLLFLLQTNTISLDSIFQLLIQQNLGESGNCPLSVYNYTFLSKTSLGLTDRSTSVRNGVRTSKVVSKKASRELFVQKFSCKSPVYHNCKIYANDGRLLCYCDRRKLEWYVNRNLAKLVEDDPPAIMLLFEPKGRPEDEDNDFYIQSKKNICVGCGEGNHYLRYRIIPSCYRMHFPEHLKSHRSHDIVLLCVDCHEIAHAAAEKHKRKIAAEFGIPLFVQKVAEIDNQTNIFEFPTHFVPSERVGVSPLQLRTSAMALLRHGSEMPSERREELMTIVMAYYGGREISEVDLERALVLGMSPHERRRFEKKRGFTFKHLTRCNDPNNGEETKTDRKHDSVDTSILKDTEDSTHLPSSSYKDGDYAAVFYTDSDDVDSDFRSTPSVGKDAYIPGSERNCRTPVKDDSLKHESKLSLLGHGPHGKHVIIHLLKEYGEDGIHEFCRRWRQVFVEALHPRFLPSGWDVMHSGKRQFGDFSVYNPSKSSGTGPA